MKTSRVQSLRLYTITVSSSVVYNHGYHGVTMLNHVDLLTYHTTLLDTTYC